MVQLPAESPFSPEDGRKRALIEAARRQAEDLAETATHRRCDSDTDAGRITVRCPSCNEPIEIAVDASLTDLTCSSCGSYFNLVDQSQETSLAPSIAVVGRFELIERLGMGAFGAVWKARDKELDRTVAVKVPRQGDMTAEEKEKFLREARAAAQLRHPNIVSVHEVGRDGDSVFIVSDFVRGVTLADWLTDQRMTGYEAAELCAKIAAALHHAHEKKVVHRDLKPANIMIDGDSQPHIMDFGLARREVGEATVTIDGRPLGTPAYMSPEQAIGEAHTADRRSDVYSLGVILFRLLTGELPFRGNARMLIHQVINEEPPSPRKLNATVPRDLETITLKCLEKEPAKRYQTARDLSDELERFVTGEPILARPVGRIERGWRWCKRHQAVSWLSALLLFMLLAISVIAPIIAVQQSRLRRESELRRIELQNEIARSLFQRACEEYYAGRGAVGISLLARAYEFSGGREVQTSLNERFRSSIRRMMSSWAREIGRPIVQNGAVLAAELSPDGKMILVGGHDDNCRARFWDAKTLLPVGDSLPLDASVRAVAFSPDGSLALTGSEDGVAQLWDTQKRTRVGKPMRHSTGGEPRLVWAVAFGSDGIVATGGGDNMLRFWQAPSGDSVGQPIQHQGPVVSVDFDSDGDAVVTGSYDGTAHLWDTQTRQQLGKTIQVKQPPVYAARISPGGGNIVTGSKKGTAQLWESQTGQLVGDLSGHTDEVYAVASSADGRTVLTGSHDNTARLWDVETRLPLGEALPHNGWVMSVAYSPNGRTVITGSADGMVRLWNISDSGGRVLQHQGEVHAAVFSADGRIALTAGDDNVARLWDVRTAQPLGKPLSHGAPIAAVAFSPDGTSLVTASADRVQHWNAQTGEAAREPWRFDGAVRDVAFSADGTALRVNYAHTTNQSVELRDYPSGIQRSSPLQFDDEYVILACSRDQEEILVGQFKGRQGSVAQLWSLPTGTAIGEPVRRDGRILTAELSRDGTSVVTGGRDQQVYAWTISSAGGGRSFQHDGIVNAVSISRDGRTIISGSDDKTARLWDARTGLALGPPLVHLDRVVKVALSPDGQVAVTVSSEGAAFLWDVFSSKRLARPLRYEVGVEDCVFHPDGSEILFRCTDGTARLYSVPQQLPDDPDFIRVWARSHSGYEVDEKHEPRKLLQDEWLKAQEKLVLLENGQ